MNISDFNALNEELIAHLLRIPFVFNNTLRSQLQVAKLDYESFPDLYRLYFRKDGESPLFPEYLDMMPLSWQILSGDAPLLIQLFIKDGFISELEVVNMGLGEIHWAYIWNAVPMLNFCYDLQAVEMFLSSEQHIIYRINYSQNSIDLGIQSQEQNVVASFRGCQIHVLPKNTEFLQTQFEFKNSTTDSSILVTSTDGRISFTCQLPFLQWHATLG